MKKATLTVYCGPMKAEKSTAALRSIRRALKAGVRVDVALPELDNRSAGEIRTHDGASSSAYGLTARTVPSVPGTQMVSSAEWARGCPPDAQRHIIEEAQFYDLGLPDRVEAALEAGRIVEVFGLDQDADGVPFGPMPYLLARAEKIVKLTAVCNGCGEEATRTWCRVARDGILVGADQYDPVCADCWRKLRRPLLEIPGVP